MSGYSFGMIFAILGVSWIEVNLLNPLKETQYTTAYITDETVILQVKKNIGSLRKSKSLANVAKDVLIGVREIVENVEDQNEPFVGLTKIAADSHLLGDIKRPGEVNRLFANALSKIGVDVNYLEVDFKRRLFMTLIFGHTKFMYARHGGEFEIDISTSEKRMALLQKLNAIEAEAQRRGSYKFLLSSKEFEIEEVAPEVIAEVERVFSYSFIKHILIEIPIFIQYGF